MRAQLQEGGANCVEISVFVDDQWLLFARFYFGIGYTLDYQQARAWAEGLARLLGAISEL